MLSITIGDQRPSLFQSIPTLQLSKLRQNQCQPIQMTMSPTIKGLQPLQNKSDYPISHQLARTPVLSSQTSLKSKSMQRRSNAFRLNYKNHKSSTNNAKSLSSKSEKNRIVSEKKKRRNKRKFDNFKCFVSNRKPRRLRRKQRPQQLSVNNKLNKILVFSSLKDQKYLLSTTLLQP